MPSNRDYKSLSVAINKLSGEVARHLALQRDDLVKFCLSLVALKILDVRSRGGIDKLVDGSSVDGGSVDGGSFAGGSFAGGLADESLVDKDFAGDRLVDDSSKINYDINSLAQTIVKCSFESFENISTTTTTPLPYTREKLLDFYSKNSVAPTVPKLLELLIPNEEEIDSFSIGWCYQFLCHDRRKTALSAIQSANKASNTEDLIAFTQIYTPDWIVDFLLANTVYRKWLRPATALSKELSDISSWRLPDVNTETYQPAKQLSVLDPACGAGHFLIRAFHILTEMLVHESAITLGEAAQAAQLMICGADMDPLAIWVSRLGLNLEYIKHAKRLPQNSWNLNLVSNDASATQSGDTSAMQSNNASAIQSDGAAISQMECENLGSLSKNFGPTHPLKRQYRVVVTNPPYIGRKLMSRELSVLLKRDYPECKNDLACAFLLRSMNWLTDDGVFGVITQSSILSLPSHLKTREKLFRANSLDATVMLGPAVFPLQSGVKIDSALLIISKGNYGAKGPIVTCNLLNSRQKEYDLKETIKNEGKIRFRKIERDGFIASERLVINDCPPILIRLLENADRLSDAADVRQGLATSDNRRFIKSINEVPKEEIGNIWQPYVKGAGGERWESPIRHMINWQDNGKELKAAVAAAYPYLKGNIKWVVKNEQFYFRPGLCFSFVNSKSLAVRRLPAGCIFDVAASALFPYNESQTNFLLGYLNSSLISAIAKSYNPTINMQVGDIKRLPLFRLTEGEKKYIGDKAIQCCRLAMRKHIGVTEPDVVANGELSQAVGNSHKVQSSINEQSSLYEQDDYLTELYMLEAELNKFVLECLAKNYALTAAESKEINEWVADCLCE